MFCIGVQFILLFESLIGVVCVAYYHFKGNSHILDGSNLVWRRSTKRVSFNYNVGPIPNARFSSIALWNHLCFFSSCDWLEPTLLGHVWDYWWIWLKGWRRHNSNNNDSASSSSLETFSFLVKCRIPECPPQLESERCGPISKGRFWGVGVKP